MRIIGIDPGTLCLGFGLIDWTPKQNRIDYISCGQIRMSGTEHISLRLRTLQRELEQILNKYAPDHMGIEDVFYGLNIKSAIRIGESRAICMLAAAQFDLPIVELAPASIKKAVTGSGRADKEQVKKMVTLLLALNRPPTSEDAADSLAVAIATAYSITATTTPPPPSTPQS